jgi:hypothetical protein
VAGIKKTQEIRKGKKGTLKDKKDKRKCKHLVILKKEKVEWRAFL